MNRGGNTVRAIREREDPRATVAGAAWYVQEVGAGHVTMAPAAALGHLEALLTLIEDQWLADPEPAAEETRRRRELLALVPLSQRVPGADIDISTAAAVALSRMPGDVILVVTRWLRAAKAEASQP